VLFFALHLGLHTRTGATPLVEDLLVLFVSSFLSKLSVLVLEPCQLLLLFHYVVRGIVVEVGRTSFKAINSLKLDAVYLAVVVSQIGGVKGLKRMFFHGLFRLCESSGDVV